MSGGARSRVAGPVLVGAVAAAYFAAFVGYGVNLEDEGLLLLQIARTARGDVPYVDFHTGYTPGTFYLNAALFRWLGESVLWLRLALVVVNTASVVLIHLLARPFAGEGLAALAALGFAAFLPTFPGEFASFNIPYPAWYAATAFLVCQFAIDRWLMSGGRRRWAVAGGLAAGIAFGFKPNAGVLAALALGTTVALLAAGDRAGGAGRLARAALVVTLVVLLSVFGFRLWMPEFWLIAGPLAALLALGARRARGVAALPADRVAAIAWAAAATLLVTVPWVSWALARLGIAGFLREVLLLGSNADLIYATPYPIPLGFPAGWPVLGAVGLAAFAWCGYAAERGRIAATTAVAVLLGAALAGGAVLLSWAHVPEGLVRSITWQVQHVGFYAVPVMHLAVTVILLRWLGADEGPWSLERQRLLAVVVFSAFTFVELYPRVDTMHLILALPAPLVLAAAVTARLARAWGRALGTTPAAVRGAAMLVGLALAALAVQPGLAGRVAAVGANAVALASPRVPVVLERERATDLRALGATLEYLDARLAPGEALFAFPALGLVPYALGRPTPTPHDYFFPGRPDHADEAAIVVTLAERPPRYLLTLNRRFGFFSESPAYYFLLRRHVREHYRVAARFGRYDVLARRDLRDEPMLAPAFTPPPLPGDMMARLADPDREQRRAATLDLLAQVDDGVPLDALAPGRREQLLVMRNLAELGSGRGVWPAWQTYRTGSWRVKNEAQGALNFIALHHAIARYVWAPDVAAAAEEPPRHLDDLDQTALRAVLLDRSLRSQIGVFASWVLTLRRDQDAREGFEVLVAREEDRPYFRLIGAQGLLALGDEAALETLVGMLALRIHPAQNLIPSFLLTQVPDREAVGRALAVGLGSEEPLERAASAWVAGAGGYVETVPALRAAGEEADPEVGAAVRWALDVLAQGGSG